MTAQRDLRAAPNTVASYANIKSRGRLHVVTPIRAHTHTTHTPHTHTPHTAHTRHTSAHTHTHTGVLSRPDSPKQPAPSRDEGGELKATWGHCSIWRDCALWRLRSGLVEMHADRWTWGCPDPRDEFIKRTNPPIKGGVTTGYAPPLLPKVLQQPYARTVPPSS